MSKVKLFVENFVVYGIGGVVNRIVPIIMLPIITRIMPDSSYFAINDLSSSIVSFATSFAIMGITDAMFRMFFERDTKDFKIKVCSTALVFTVCTSLIVFLLLLLFKMQIARWFYASEQYSFLIYFCAISALISGTNGVVCAPTRMENKRSVFIVLNLLTSIVSYSISIPLLLRGYYVIALPLAGLITAALSELSFLFLNYKWFSFKSFDFKLLKEMLYISLPIFPNFIIYWIFSSCDKLMITNSLGLSAAGLYAVGAKLGHCSNLIYTAFAGGWQYFSFSTMKDANQVRNNSKIFECLGIISLIATLCICAVSYNLYCLFFPEEYVKSYIVSPYLFLSPLILMLYQVQSNQFLIIKKTFPTLVCLTIGALVNVALNYILIPILNIEGAAIATMLGYVASTFLVVTILTKLKLANVSSKFYLSLLFFVAIFLLWRFKFSSSFFLGSLACIIYAIILFRLYFGEFCALILKKGI